MTKPTDRIYTESTLLRRGFVALPRIILLNPTISRDAKVLYSVLMHHAMQDDHCFPGYELLTKEVGCGKNQITRYMRELEAAQLINRRRRFGSSSVYTLLDPPIPDGALQFPQNGETVDVIPKTGTQSPQNGDTVSPKRGKEIEEQQVQKALTTPAPIPLTPPEVQEIGEKWGAFDEILRGAKRGYSTDLAFIKTLATRYPHLDPHYQALIIVDWLAEPKHRQRVCSRRFILNWLEKAEETRQARHAERATTGMPVGEPAPTSTPQTYDPPAAPAPCTDGCDPSKGIRCERHRAMFEQLRAQFSPKPRGGGPSQIGAILTTNTAQGATNRAEPPRTPNHPTAPPPHQRRGRPPASSVA